MSSGGLQCINELFQHFASKLISNSSTESNAVEAVVGFTLVPLAFLLQLFLRPVLEQKKKQAAAAEDADGGGSSWASKANQSGFQLQMSPEVMEAVASTLELQKLWPVLIDLIGPPSTFIGMLRVLSSGWMAGVVTGRVLTCVLDMMFWILSSSPDAASSTPQEQSCTIALHACCHRCLTN